MNLQIFPNLDAVSEAGTHEFVRLCHEAIEARGRFDVALSGGSTPKKMFELLASEEFRGKVDWSKVHLFWSDERYVPPTDPASNEGMARAALIEHVPIHSAQVHGMYVEGGVAEAALLYESLLHSELGDSTELDLTLLGIGPDGHTASLFPGEPAVHVTNHMVVAGIGHAGVSERITMTPPMLNRSRVVMFLVAGADKAEPMKRVLEGPENWDETPSQSVARHAPTVVWLLDEAAAKLLQMTD